MKKSHKKSERSQEERGRSNWEEIPGGILWKGNVPFLDSSGVHFM